VLRGTGPPCLNHISIIHDIERQRTFRKSDENTTTRESGKSALIAAL